MDSNGNLYASQSLRDALDEKTKREVQPMPARGEKQPEGMEPITRDELVELAGMNRAQRRAHLSKRRGPSERARTK